MNAAMKETENKILAEARLIIEAHPRMTVKGSLANAQSDAAGAVLSFVLAEREEWSARQWEARLAELEQDNRTLVEFLAAQVQS